MAAYARCELACKARHHRYYARFQKKVQDGTRCKLDAEAYCIDGECLVSAPSSPLSVTYIIIVVKSELGRHHVTSVTFFLSLNVINRATCSSVTIDL